jgi:hypothetical protein
MLANVFGKTTCGQCGTKRARQNYAVVFVKAATNEYVKVFCFFLFCFA